MIALQRFQRGPILVTIINDLNRRESLLCVNLLFNGKSQNQ